MCYNMKNVFRLNGKKVGYMFEFFSTMIDEWGNYGLYLVVLIVLLFLFIILYILYQLIKNAVKNGIIEALKEHDKSIEKSEK